MTTKRARMRKPKGAIGITRAKTHNTRAKRKAVTAKKIALANGLAAAAKKAAAATPAKATAPKKAGGKVAAKK